MPTSLKSGVQFGDLIRVRADSSDTAQAYAETYRRMALEKDHARMMDVARYDDMPGDCFILTGLHWRESMSPMSERFENGAEYVRWLQSDNSRPGGEDSMALGDRIARKRREIIERELETSGRIITLDIRIEGADPALPEAFLIRTGNAAADIARAHRKASTMRDYLRDEFGVDSRDVITFTPNHEPEVTYVFRGDTRARFDDLQKHKGDLPFETVFGWFVEGLREQGLLRQIDMRQGETS